MTKIKVVTPAGKSFPVRSKRLMGKMVYESTQRGTASHLGRLYEAGVLAPMPRVGFLQLESLAPGTYLAATLGRVARTSNQPKSINPFESLTDFQAVRLGGDIAEHIRAFEDGWDEQDSWLAAVMS